MTYLWLCLVVTFSLQVAHATPASDYKSYKDYKLYELTGEKSVLEKLVKYVTENFEVPVHMVRGTTAQILVPPTAVGALEDFDDVNITLVIPDYSQIILAEKVAPRGTQFSWTAYHDVDDVHSFLHNISAAHPDYAQVIVGGSSYEGRQLLGVRINTQERARKPVFFIESGIHAREWITPASTTYFIHQLLTSTNPNITAMRDKFDWRIFPTINPDGYHYTFTTDRMWRKTRSRSSKLCYGVDPNRNWDYNWGQYSSSKNPCDKELFAGPKPFSEQETRTLSQYISGIENLAIYVAFHADAQMLLLPYSDSNVHVDNYEDLVRIGKTSLEYGTAVKGVKFWGPATAAEILYRASGGSMDWVRHALGTPLVFTYELHGRNFHWPHEKIPQQGDEVTQMMLGLITEAEKMGYF